MVLPSTIRLVPRKVDRESVSDGRSHVAWRLPCCAAIGSADAVAGLDSTLASRAMAKGMFGSSLNTTASDIGR